MKRNCIILLFLLILSNIYSFSQEQPRFRGANATISSLANKYCSTDSDIQIVPDTWDSRTTVINWTVTYQNFSNPNQTSWYTITGTGQSTVLHFNPKAVPSTYYGVPIVFHYDQTNAAGVVRFLFADDYTYVYKTPTAYTLGSDTTICPGQTAQLTLSGSEDSINYTLYKDGVKTSTTKQGTDSSITFNVSAAGTYTVKAQNISDSACTVDMSGSAKVSLYSTSTPTISGSANVCIGATNVVYTTDEGQSNYTWTISDGGVITSTTTTNKISVTWNKTGSQSVSVNYTNTNGCTATSATTFNVKVHDLPTPTITDTTSACKGSTVTYTTESGMSGYLWTVTGGSIVSGAGTDSLTVQWNTVGTQTLTVTYTDTYGCSPSSPTTAYIKVNEVPSPTISGTSEVCQGTSGVIYSTESGQSDYTWTITGGSITAGKNTNQVTVTWNTAGSQTITVNYANALGCKALTPTSYTVTVHPLPTPTISGKDSVCLGETNTIYTTEENGTDYTWTVSSGGTITSGANTNEVYVTWNTAGVQTISVTYKNTYGCSAASATSYNVTISNRPTPSISGSDTVCNGTTGITYTTAPGQSNYVWTVSSGGTITSGQNTYQINVTWSSTGNQTISVNYANTSGCTATSATTKNIYVKALPTPTIAGPQSFCIDTSAIKTYATESGNSDYTWTVSSGGKIISGQSTDSITVKWTSTGSQTVSVTYTNTKGCTAATPTTYTVTVNPLPTPTINGSSSVCQGTQGVTYTTESGMTGYTWSITGGTITSGANTNAITVTWNTAGKQTLSVNYSNTYGCTAAKATVDTVTVISAASPTITGLTKACAGATGITYTTETGMSNYTWTISSGGTITSGSTTNEITVTWNAIGEQSITVNYENTLGCAAVAPVSQTVTIYNIPVPTITGSDSACQNETSTYTTESGMSSYTWTVTGGSILSGAGTDSITVKWDTTGAQIITLNYVNQGNCTAEKPDTDTIWVFTPPTPTITGSDTVCANGGSTTYTTETNQTNYTWTVSGNGTIVSGQGTNSANIAWTTAGDKIVSVNYKNSNGCEAVTASTFNVYAQASPTPKITGSQTVCIGATGVIYKTDSGKYNYQWTINGGTITSGLGTDSVSVNWDTAGNQTISVNYTNSDSCSALTPTAYNVTVTALPVPTITASNGGCNSTTTTYTTESGMQNYVWTVSGGYSASSGNGTNTFLVTWDSTGTQTVSVTYQTTIGCAANSPTSKTVTITNNPTVTLSVSDSTICKGDLVTFNATSGLANYDFHINSSTIDKDSDSTYSTTSLSNNDKIYVVGTSSNGCIGTSDTIGMTVYDLPVATLSASPDTIIIKGTDVTFTSTGGSDYQFYLNGTLVQAYSSTNTYSNSTLNNGDVISVKVKNTHGCIDSVALKITVLDSIASKSVADTSLIYCTGSSTNGVTVYITNPQSGVSYELIRVTDSHSFGLGTISADSVVWHNVTNTIIGTQTYKIIGYYSSLTSYKVEMANRITITKVSMPDTYSVLPSDTVKICSDGTNGSEIKLSGSQVGVSYYLYDNGVYTGIAISGTGSAISFGTIKNIGTYTVVAKTDVGDCENTMSGSSRIVLDNSSSLCYPFVAVPDVLYLEAGASSGNLHVSDNDTLNSTLDKNLQYTLITSWTDANGNTAQTNGTVTFESSSQDYLTYTKKDNYYGKDSVIYQIINTDYPNRKDTAIIHIFIGNKSVSDDSITILIPNAFTPNGDNKNDLFVIEGIDNQLASQLKVFNRWGSQVYQSEGTTYNSDWDGTCNKGASIGKQLPVGTYFYIFSVTFDKNGKNIHEKYNGYIELMR